MLDENFQVMIDADDGNLNLRGAGHRRVTLPVLPTATAVGWFPGKVSWRAQLPCLPWSRPGAHVQSPGQPITNMDHEIVIEYPAVKISIPGFKLLLPLLFTLTPISLRKHSISISRPDNATPRKQIEQIALAMHADAASVSNNACGCRADAIARCQPQRPVAAEKRANQNVV